MYVETSVSMLVMIVTKMHVMVCYTFLDHHRGSVEHSSAFGQDSLMMILMVVSIISKILKSDIIYFVYDRNNHNKSHGGSI